MPQAHKLALSNISTSQVCVMKRSNIQENASLITIIMNFIHLSLKQLSNHKLTCTIRMLSGRGVTEVLALLVQINQDKYSSLFSYVLLNPIYIIYNILNFQTE